MKKLLLMLMLMAPLATFAQKFGKVNTQTIMQNLPEIAKINGELQATAKQYENDLKGMQDELKRQSDAYDKAKSTMNPTAQKQKEEELNTLYQKRWLYLHLRRGRCCLHRHQCRGCHCQGAGRNQQDEVKGIALSSA